MSPKYFRLLIVATWVVNIIGLVLGFTMERSLPEDLQLYLEMQGEASSDEHWIFLWALWLVWLIGWVIALITDCGLFFFKMWAKKLMPWTILAGFILTPFFPPTIEHSIVSAFLYLGNIMYGAVFALVYFSPLAERFEAAPRLQN